jgi:soluble lytic murein transglycosylase-like protein
MTLLSRLWAIVCLAGAVLCAQPPANFEDSVKAAMAPSLAQQRAAVEQQASAAGGVRDRTRHAFFTTPFLSAAPGAADCDPLPAGQLDALAGRAAQKTGIGAPLVRAVIDQESGGRPCAVSSRGAQGLMQLMPATSEDYGVDDAFDPEQNVEAGSKLLKSLLDRYQNDPERALGAYNAGATRVDEAGGLPRIPETTDYVNAILGKLRSLLQSQTTAGKDNGDPAMPELPAMKNSGWTTQEFGKEF